MAPQKFNLIAAASENMGIGIKGHIPWRLKNELKYFNQMTCKVSDPNKLNACIMGRKTYYGIPLSKRPLPQRLNIVLSKTSSATDYPPEVILCGSLAEAMERLASATLVDKIENIWIVGGSRLYSEAMQSPHFNRLYFTQIMAEFECDTFFPTITDEFKQVANDQNIPADVQEENGFKYEYKIYEKV